MIRKKETTKSSRIGDEIWNLSGKLSRISNDEHLFHEHRNMENTLRKLKEEAQNLDKMFQKVHKNPPSYIYAIPASEPVFLVSETSQKEETGLDVGYFIQPKAGTPHDFEQDIFSSESNPKDIALFRKLNENKRQKAGSILIVADHKKQIPYHIQPIYEAQTAQNKNLESLTEDEADFLYHHYELIKTILEKGDVAIGTLFGSSEYIFSEISKIMHEINVLHDSTLAKHGTLYGVKKVEFLTPRNALLAKLDSLLTLSAAQKTVKIPPYESLKHALKLNRKYLVHHYKTAGKIDWNGYLRYQRNAAKLAKYLHAGGWIAVGFSGLAAANNIHHACTYGREEECKVTTFKEVGGFTGGVGAGMLAGLATAKAAGAICLTIGISSAGIGGALCAVGVVVVGGISAGYLGEYAGQKMGELIYKVDNWIEETKSEH